MLPPAAQRNAKDRAGRSPGELLLYSTTRLSSHRPGNLTNGLRLYVDYLEMTSSAINSATAIRARGQGQGGGSPTASLYRHFFRPPCYALCVFFFFLRTSRQG